jgi:acetyl esterase/lipase
MKSFLHLFAPVLLLITSAPAEIIPLWSGGAPGAKGDRPEDIPKIEPYLPGEHPCGAGMVVCPGGGYGGLAADHEGKQVAQFYNSLGITAFVLTYRLGSQGYHQPIELNDAKRALRWVRANAEKFHLDPQRIGITGFSAGGHLASSAGTLFDEGDPNAADPVDRVSSRPDILVLGYPVITLMNDFTHRGSRNNLLGPDKDDDALAARLSSQNNVTDRTPPTFLFLTDEDSAVPAENGVSFYLALRKHHVPAEMHIYQRGPHGVGLMHGDPVLGTWRHHLADWLRNNSFLAATKRGAVEGKVTVNGRPVSWGSIAFYPADPHLPLANARVMHGAFKLDEKSGPPVGTQRLEIWFSAADVPSLTEKEAPEGVMHVDKLSPADTQPVTVEIKEGANPLSFEVKYP